MSKMIYNQCTLVKRESTNDPDAKIVTTQVSYIPKKYAQLNRVLKLKEGDIWEDGWKITSVGSDTPEDQVPDVHSDIKGHRKMTGDSIKK